MDYKKKYLKYKLKYLNARKAFRGGCAGPKCMQHDKRRELQTFSLWVYKRNMGFDKDNINYVQNPIQTKLQKNF